MIKKHDTYGEDFFKVYLFKKKEDRKFKVIITDCDHKVIDDQDLSLRDFRKDISWDIEFNSTFFTVYAYDTGESLMVRVEGELIDDQREIIGHDSIKDEWIKGSPKAEKFNHAFTIAFSLDSDFDAENFEKIPCQEFYRAITRRIASISTGGDCEIHEAVGMPFDTYENN